MQKTTYKLIIIFVFLFLFVGTAQFVFAAEPSFSDVNRNDWFYEYVTILTGKDIIHGYGDGTYCPQKSVSFGEFISIATRLVAADKIPDKNPGPHWASGNYQAALKCRLISSGDFSGDIAALNAPICREDMALILTNIAAANNEDLKVIDGVETAINDFVLISANRRLAVLKAYSNGLLSGSKGFFNPKEHLTRAEVASVFCRVMKYTNRPAVVIESVETASFESNIVLSLVNAERKKAGLKPLIMDAAMVKAAKAKAKDMAALSYFAHKSPTYGGPADMLNQFGIVWSCCGENLATGQISPESAVHDWMNSTPHRNSILSTKYEKTGIATARDKSGKIYWVQLFAS